MSAKSAYRPDIDGIRAIAVGSVLIFHAFPGLLPGGFVGVDIFFVISGFLITGILAREYEATGRIDFAEFYARRVRRLLPALGVMIAVTLALGLWLIPPIGDLQAVGKSAASALAFVSNLYFTKAHLGYFDNTSDLAPLLHTWTLAVEEQFYIVWPPLLIVTGWLAQKAGMRVRTGLLAMLAAVFVVSLAMSIWATTYYPTYAFYLTPFRAWEFAIGALLSMTLGRVAISHPAANALGALGVLLIGATVVFFDQGTPFPGYQALLPTLGAAALLAAGASRNLVSGVLARNPFVYIGKISYGWYLWHWPLLAILRSVTLNTASTLEISAALALSFVLSAASYHWIEKPIRHQQPRMFKTTRWSLIAGAGMIVVGVGASLGAAKIADYRLAASPRLQTLAGVIGNAGDPVRIECKDIKSQFTRLPPAQPCFIGDPAARKLVVLWGDSHAAHFTALLDAWGKQAHVAVLARVRGGCRPLIGKAATVGVPPSETNMRNCWLFREAVLAETGQLARERPTTLMVVTRWPDQDSPATVSADPLAMAALVKQSVDAIIAGSRRDKYGLILAKDTPYLPYDVPRCLLRYSVTGCSVTRETAERNRDEASRMIDAVTEANPSIKSIDPFPAICDLRWCYAERDGIVLYWDTGHLTNQGSRYLAPTLAPQLNAAMGLP